MKSSGVTLLEILIVMTLMAALGATAMGYYRNYAKSTEFTNAAKSIIFDLKRMQGRAVAGQDQLKWGIRFANGAFDTYETFSTATTYAAGTVTETFYLPSTLIFTSPAESSTTDMIFKRISGGIDSSSTGGGTVNVLVTIQSEGKSQTVTVTTQGNIY